MLKTEFRRLPQQRFVKPFSERMRQAQVAVTEFLDTLLELFVAISSSTLVAIQLFHDEPIFGG